jgi:hypothetical protein
MSDAAQEQEVVALRSDVEEMKRIIIEQGIQMVQWAAQVAATRHDIQQLRQMFESMNSIDLRNPMGGKIFLEEQ